MNEITINKKMSGTGTIYDISSDLEDISIDMSGYSYAVLLPAYYNATPTRHRTMSGVLRAVKKLQTMGYDSWTVMDSAGNDISGDVDYQLYIN